MRMKFANVNFKSWIYRPVNPIGPLIFSVHAVLFGIWTTFFVAGWEISPAYEAMRVLPQWSWGLTAVVVGLYSMYTVLRGNTEALGKACRILFLFWVFITVSFGLGTWQSTAVPTYGLIAAYTGFTFLNTRFASEDYYERL